jgi:hypothetical protein
MACCLSTWLGLRLQSIVFNEAEGKILPHFVTREKVTGGWIRLNNEEPHNLYTSQNIIREVKWRRIRWAGQVTCMGWKCIQSFGRKTCREETTHLALDRDQWRALMNTVKAKLSLCYNWAPRREGVLGEWRYNSTHSLTSALDRGEWSTSRPGRFTPRERTPCTHWIGDWVGPRAVLDTGVKRKISSPRWESNPRTPIVQPVAQRYTDWAITALVWTFGFHKVRGVSCLCEWLWASQEGLYPMEWAS